MKRKHTPNEMQNITSFFTKKNPTPTSLPHPTQNEQTITPPQQSEQLSSPSHYSTQNSPQNEQGQCSPNAPIFGERLSEHEFANLPQDPGKRRKMSQFHKDDRDLVRRIYIQRKPCQPKDFTFPQTSIFGKNRRFCAKWFDTWTWLEYSVEKDAAYCFPCYLFKDENAFGGDAFVSDGFKSWNRSDLIRKHVGKHLSAHNNAVLAMDLFKKQNSSITQALTKQTAESTNAYRTRLEASIESIQWLLLQGLPFRGHDEKESSLRRGNFLSLLSLISKGNPEYSKVVFKIAWEIKC
ncbi:zinc finger MYM-type protein 1-like [Chenopodium quinoa]|nr:zinc finger MYM-type protein 1-like [Chenopodium quinoa]